MTTPTAQTDPSTPLVARHDDAGVVTLTLNRPDKLNALSPVLFVELSRHLDALESLGTADETVRCVVLQGAGRSFCAGHDLESIAARERAPSKHFEPETIDRLAELAVPTIAKLRGHCLTGGLELALACDLLVAGASTKLGDTHGRWGLVPAWGMSVRLPERVGVATAKQLMFTSRVIDASTAHSIGLVDRVSPDDELDADVAELAGEIVANSRGTNRIAKQLLAERHRRTPLERLQSERDLAYGVPTDMNDRMRRGGR